MISSTGFESLDRFPPDFLPSTEFAQALVQLHIPGVLNVSENATKNEFAFAPGAIVDPERARLVDSKRADAGIRVERTLATLAFRAGRIGETQLRLSSDGHFAPDVATAMLTCLDVPVEVGEPILINLHRELLQSASRGAVHGGWGKLVTGDNDLWIDVAPAANPISSPRQRAKVIHRVESENFIRRDEKDHRNPPLNL